MSFLLSCFPCFRPRQENSEEIPLTQNFSSPPYAYSSTGAVQESFAYFLADPCHDITLTFSGINPKNPTWSPKVLLASSPDNAQEIALQFLHGNSQNSLLIKKCSQTTYRATLLYDSEKTEFTIRPEYTEDENLRRFRLDKEVSIFGAEITHLTFRASSASY